MAIQLFDRACLSTNVTAGRVVFEDNSFRSFGPLFKVIMTGRPTVLEFLPYYQTNFFSVYLDATVGSNPGLGEILIIGSPTFSNTSNAFSCTPVLACPPGSYIVTTNTLTADQTCIPCPAQTFSVAYNVNISSCSPWSVCPPGTYITVNGTTTAGPTCATCPSFTFSDTTNSFACRPWTVCYPGSFVNVSGTVTRSTTCASCNQSFYSNTTNALTCLNCVSVSTCTAGYQLDGVCNSTWSPSCVKSRCICGFSDTDIGTGNSSYLCDPYSTMPYVQNGRCVSTCFDTAYNTDLTSAALYRSYNPVTNLTIGYISYPNCFNKQWCTPTNCAFYAPDDCSRCLQCSSSFELTAIDPDLLSYRPCKPAARPYFRNCADVSFNLRALERPPIAVSWILVAMDDESGIQFVQCTDTTNQRRVIDVSTYMLGQTTVTCTTTDWANYTVQNNCSLTVTITDVTPPVFNCPLNAFYVIVKAGEKIGSFNWSIPIAIDYVDGVTNVTCDRALSNTTFGLGSNNIYCTSSDKRPNTATCIQQVFIRDVSAPNISCPANLQKNLTGYQFQFVTFAVSAVDPASQITLPQVTCSPPSGSTFAVASTPVLCTAYSTVSGQSASCSFEIIIADITAPVVSCSNQVVTTSSGRDTAEVSLTGQVFDNSGGLPPTLLCEPPTNSAFDVGTTIVTCHATDASLNTGT